MNSIKFAKTKLIFDLCNYISEKRNSLLEDLVAYTEDPVRYSRRIRMLKQLAQYEQSMLEKVEQFDTRDDSDIISIATIDEFIQEIDIIASLNT